MTAEALGFDTGRLSRVQQRMEAEIAAGRYHGAALIVARHGEIALRTVHGYADRAAGRKLTDRDVFATMSVGKQLTNVLVLNRVDRGELLLHTPVHEIIPEFRERGWRELKMFHLLTHTGGVESENPPVPLDTLLDIGRLTAHVASRRPESPPGERVIYATMQAHSVLAEVVRRLDGGERSFRRIIAEDLFEPLGMHETSLGPRPDLMARLCPIKAAFSGPGMVPAEFVEGVMAILQAEGELPAGGYVTTLDDFYRFTAMLRNGGELDGVRILSPHLLRYCAQNHTGAKTNALWDYTRDTRGWTPWPAAMGVGFWMRGETVQPGPMSNLSSARTFCGWGAGSTCFWVDPEMDLAFTFLSTGIMEAADHVERVQRLSDLVIGALVA